MDHASSCFCSTCLGTILGDAVTLQLLKRHSKERVEIGDVLTAVDRAWEKRLAVIGHKALLLHEHAFTRKITIVQAENLTEEIQSAVQEAKSIAALRTDFNRKGS